MTTAAALPGETTPQGVETILGLPINPIDNLGNYSPIRFYNLWEGVFPNGNNLITDIPDGTQNPQLAINYLHHKSDLITKAAQQRPLVRLGDANLNILAEMTGEMSMEFEELMADSGKARYVVRYDNWLVDYIVNLTQAVADLHLIIDPIPTATTWRTRWGGKIQTINIERHEDGTSTVELLAISNREHAKHLLLASTPIFPPEVQPLKMWVLPGPLRTILFTSCFINLARLFVPGLSFVTNIFNPASWVDPLNFDSVFNVDPLSWPIQFAFVDPITDTSTWEVLAATWTDWHSATQDMLMDAGVMLRAYTWLTEDLDSPYDELNNAISLLPTGLTQVIDTGFTDLINLVDGVVPSIASLLKPQAQAVSNALGANIRPTRNCVIFRAEDKSGRAGPTGTALDGLLSVIGITLDDLITSTLVDTNTGLQLDGEPVVDLNGDPVPIAQSLLGVAPEVPKVIWREGQFTGLLDAAHVIHKGSPKTVMTGGHSPSIVNQLQTFGIRYALSQLSDVINLGIANDFGLPLQDIPTNGIENIYQGQFDNVLFAWERVTDPQRALYSGDLAFQEYFERGSATAYTLSGIVTLGTALWKTRAYQGFKAKVRNGMPWLINQDTTLGDRNGFEFYGVIYVDQIYSIKCSVDRKKPLLWELQIGEDKNTFNPLGRLMRAATGVYTMVGAMLGEGILS